MILSHKIRIYPNREHGYGRSAIERHHINKEIAKSLEIAYDSLKIIQQQVWCEHDKS